MSERTAAVVAAASTHKNIHKLSFIHSDKLNEYTASEILFKPIKWNRTHTHSHSHSQSLTRSRKYAHKHTRWDQPPALERTACSSYLFSVLRNALNIIKSKCLWTQMLERMKMRFVNFYFLVWFRLVSLWFTPTVFLLSLYATVFKMKVRSTDHNSTERTLNSLAARDEMNVWKHLDPNSL